ncbi:MAG: hypothetical protein QXP43_05405 [Nitrososphaerota archaeon]|nr:hypothetical protein [Candidatus Calditenuis fumarioli]
MSARERMREVKRELEQLSVEAMKLRDDYEKGNLRLEEYLAERFRLEVLHTARAISALRRAFRME